MPPNKKVLSRSRNAIVLVAGTTVGAGILALPAVTQAAGFVPSTVALTGAWMYMATTGSLTPPRVVDINPTCRS